MWKTKHEGGGGDGVVRDFGRSRVWWEEGRGKRKDINVGDRCKCLVPFSTSVCFATAQGVEGRREK